MAKKISIPRTNRTKAKPRPTTKRPAFVVPAAKAIKEARTKIAEGIAERAASKILISPDEISGDYDVSRALLTSMGGAGKRAITHDDLRTFRQIVNELGKRFVGGISPKQVIDLSTRAARDRAHAQIHTAIPIRNRGGRIEFTTNAGPDSRHKRHTVIVELLNFEACVASPIDSIKMATELIKGKVKMDCDCEDWRYRLRYLATVGHYASGPWYEHSFPKITNPMLYGVGCKHVLRVMSLISQSPTFKHYAAKMIDTGRKTVDRKATVTKIKDIEEFAEKFKKERSRQRAVKSTEEKRAARNKVSLSQQMQREIAKAEKKEKEKMDRDKKAAIRAIEINAKKLLELGVINQQQMNAMLAAASGK